MIIFKRLLPDPSSLEISVDFTLAKSISPLVAQKRSTSGAKCSSSIVGRGAQHLSGELHTGGQAAQVPVLSSALLQDLSCWSISGSVSPLPKGRMFPESLWHCCETGEASQKEPLASHNKLFYIINTEITKHLRYSYPFCFEHPSGAIVPVLLWLSPFIETYLLP